MHPVPVLSRVRGAFQKNRYPADRGKTAGQDNKQRFAASITKDNIHSTKLKPPKNAPP